jgi:hypothetical protein
MNRNMNFRYKSIVPISKKEERNITQYDTKDTSSSYKSLLAESFVSGIGTGAGYQIVTRTLDNILGPKTINIKNETIYGNSGGCINELTQFIDCVKENGYYQCNKSFNEFEKCYSK